VPDAGTQPSGPGCVAVRTEPVVHQRVLPSATPAMASLSMSPSKTARPLSQAYPATKCLLRASRSSRFIVRVGGYNCRVDRRIRLAWFPDPSRTILTWTLVSQGSDYGVADEGIGVF
jgi:hypothetical protein